MIKLLVKKQFQEMFKNYFYNSKKNEQRSKSSILLLLLTFVLIMVVILGGMFSALAIGICPVLLSVGLDWFYLMNMGIAALVLGAFGSVFSTYSSLYLAKDNDILLSLPIKVKDILISRLLSVYLMGVIYSGLAMIPAIVVYLYYSIKLNQFHWMKLIGSIDYYLLITLLILILSCTLGYVVARLSLKLKNKSYVSVLISLSLLGIYYYFYFKLVDGMNQFIANIVFYGNTVKGKANLLYLFGLIGTGDVKTIFVFTLVILVFTYGVYRILQKSFIKIATASPESTSKVYTSHLVKQQSIDRALFMREWKRFTSSANYMLNSGMGSVMFFLVGGYLLFKGTDVIESLLSVYEMDPSNLLIYLIIGLCLIGAMNDSVAASVSLEGKNIWITKSLPVATKQILYSKMKIQLVITLIPFLICSGLLIYKLDLGIIDGMFMVLIPSLMFVLFAHVGLIANLLHANLNWINELTVIKQGFPVFIAMFGGWIISLGMYGLVYLFKGLPLVYCLIFIIVIEVIIIFALNRWLNQKGCAIYERL